MKLTKPIVKMLSELMSIASKLGTSSIIIEPGFVRAIDENRSVVVLSEHTLDLPFASLAISRVDLLAKRLMIASGDVDISYEAHESSNQVISLKIKSGRASVDFRCVSAASIKVPKVIAEEFNTTLTMDEEAATNLTKGRSMMGASVATLLYQHNDLLIEICDENSDVFSFNVGTDLVDSERKYFAYRYDISKLSTILTGSKQTPILIGDNRGILKTTVNGFTVYLLPFVEK